MKTTRLITALFIAVIATATAQVKLWTWTPTTTAAFRTLHAITMADDGSAAFVIGETQPGIWDHNDKPASSYLIVWVDPRGRVLLSSPLQTNHKGTEVQLLEKSTRWTISFMGSSKLAVSDSESLHLYKLDRWQVKLKTVNLVDSEVQTATMFFGKEATNGWMERKTVSAGSLMVELPDENGTRTGHLFQLWDIRSISAWRF